MGLWNALKKLWNWLWNGSGFDVDELARRLGCSAADLVALEPVYREFTVPKRSGGRRRLCAPEDRLKALQRQILHGLLRRLKVHPAATGFERGQSIVTHARRHAGQAVVVRLDVKDFFPSTSAHRVYAYFRAIGWNRPAAGLLTRLCTHRGGLPQGAPSSPRLSNLVNYRLDCRLAALCKRLGATYSRYADDITLSFRNDHGKRVRRLIRLVRRVVGQEGYWLHGAKKLRIRRRHQRQCVTGLVVNEGVHLPRAVRRRLRAAEHHLRMGRPATLTTEQLAGWRAYEHMIAAQALEPARAEQMRKERDSLEGTWTLVAQDRSGTTPAGETTHSFAGLKWLVVSDRIVLELGGERVEARYRFDPFRSPKTIDLTPTQGPQRGRTLRGIYELQPALLKVCINSGKGQRPTELVPSPDLRWTLLVLQRVNEA
jgi:uncharacterized protein (TIGR03067 family)